MNRDVVDAGSTAAVAKTMAGHQLSSKGIHAGGFDRFRLLSKPSPKEIWTSQPVPGRRPVRAIGSQAPPGCNAARTRPPFGRRTQCKGRTKIFPD